MDGTLPKISFLKLQGRVAPITPWGWMGVDGMVFSDAGAEGEKLWGGQ